MTQKDASANSIALTKLVAAALFLFLALIWPGGSTLMRFALAAAGIAFLVEGIVKYIKGSRKGGSAGGNGVTEDP